MRNRVFRPKTKKGVQMTISDLTERLKAVGEHIAVISDKKHEKADTLRENGLDKLAKALTDEATGLDAIAAELSDVATELDRLSVQTNDADD
jgi:hypothetical protein